MTLGSPRGSSGLTFPKRATLQPRARDPSLKGPPLKPHPLPPSLKPWAQHLASIPQTLILLQGLREAVRVARAGKGVPAVQKGKKDQSYILPHHPEPGSPVGSRWRDQARETTSTEQTHTMYSALGCGVSMYHLILKCTIGIVLWRWIPRFREIQQWV